MSNATNYSDLVVRTFRTGAVKTAMIIDDMFPTYAEVLTSSKEKLQPLETEKACKVYETLRKARIQCDIENVPGNLASERFEHIRKSDLIVLDFHLRGPGNDDASDAIQLLAKLADSPHFNLVVVYTAAKQLKPVWLQIATRLRGEWKNPSDFLGRDTAALGTFEQLEEENKLPAPSEDDWVGYILQDKVHNPGLARGLGGLGFQKSDVGNALRALIHASVRAAFKDDKLNDLLLGKRRCLRGHFDEPYWILCGNVFLVLTSKRDPESAPVSTDDPEGILTCLDQALQDWNPNLIQLLISEFHNVIDRDSVPIEGRILQDTETQAGWIYLFLQEYLAQGQKEATVGIVQELIRRLFTTVERRITSNVDLIGFVEQAFDASFVEKPASPMTGEQLVGMAIQAGRLGGLGTRPGVGVVHALNCFLCSEDFDGRNVTTGTIFRDSGSADWWVCVWPQCDLVPREPKGELQWRKVLHPAMPMLALRLEEVTPGPGLEKAEEGRHVFVNADGQRFCLRAFDALTNQPSPQMFILESNSVDHNRVFRAFVIRNDGNAQPTISLREFRAMAQLRDSYANRLLQQTGHHTSRIGVDYVNFTAENTYAQKQAEKQARGKALVCSAPKPESETTTENKAAGAEQAAKLIAPEVAGGGKNEPLPEQLSGGEQEKNDAPPSPSGEAQPLQGTDKPQ